MATVVAARHGRFLLLGLVLAHLAAISHQVDGGGGVSLLHRALLVVFSPVQSALGAAVGGLGELWRGWGFHHETYQENRRLKAEVRRLELALMARTDEAGEAARLRELLGLQRATPSGTVPARVVARDGAPWFRSLTIDKGESDGVALNAPVISPTGVVGRVFAVGPGAARVQVLVDRDAGAGVLLERSRVAGVVVGQVVAAESGAEDLVLKYVPERADVAVGDLVVTSGLDGIYPKGLVVGRVRFAGGATGLFRDIRVEPSARFDRLEEVLVLQAAPADEETPRSVE